MASTQTADADVEIAIIGAGFAGLCLAINLKKAGIDDFVVLERSDRVGGVWRDNTYPGCACDVPSHLYSFSFEPNPDWSRMYPTQTELLAYQQRCAKKYGIEPHIRFHSELTRADFDPEAGLWTITLKDGRSLRARVLANGAGGLNKPSIPEIPGLERFAGATFHTAQWKHDVELRGKRVAVIGTGASAIQVVPEIAKLAGKLYVYQRTPPWIMPKRDPAISPTWKRRFASWPGFRRSFRALLYWLHELGALNFLRRPTQAGAAERAALHHLQTSVRDPEVRARLTPDYRLGCKRILLSNDYFPTFNRENVELVSDGIREITERGIRTNDGRERELDAIVFATGFKATEFVRPVEVCGNPGHQLSREWAIGAPSYLGIMVAGYPNFFLIGGPNTGLGHNSMIFMIESQVEYIVKCVRMLRRQREGYLEVRSEAQERFTARIQRRMLDTVWASGCKSWYQSEDGRIFTLWPGFTFQYWLQTRRVRSADFHLAPQLSRNDPTFDAATQAAAE